MPEPVLLLIGSALIMAGVFGLIEVAIRSRPRPIPQTVAPSRPAAADQAPLTEIEETYLELTVVRDREINPDGQPRQEIISNLEVGDPVVLVPETTEDGDEEIRVVASDGTIGYVPDNRVPGLLEVLANSISSSAEISYVGRVDDVFSAWVTVAVRS